MKDRDVFELKSLDVGLPLSRIESIRLQRRDAGLSLVYATTETREGDAPYLTVFTEVPLDGGAPARIFEVPQLLAARCTWDIERAPDGSRSLLINPHLGATRELRRVLPGSDPFPPIREAQRALLLSIHHRNESFSHP